MQFLVEKASDWNYEEKVEINTLEELIEFMNKAKEEDIMSDTGYFHGLILSFNRYAKEEDPKFCIEIYDDYIE